MEEIRTWSQSDKNNGYFRWRAGCTYFHISLNSS